MKVQISGSSGFVGVNLRKYLVDKRVSEVEEINLRNADPQISRDTFAVIHLAGKAHDLRKTSGPEAYYEVNYGLTKRLFEEFIKSDASKFIFLSSVKAAADQVIEVLYEDTPAQPQTDYGKSKLMAEEFLRSQVLPKGKFCYILRPCMIHGPGNKGNLNLLYQLVKRGIPYPLAAFKNKRSFLSVENLCFVINELLHQAEVPSGIYNIADDESLSTSDVVEILSGSLGRKGLQWNISPKIIRLIAKIGDVIRLPLNSEKLDKLTESYVVSNSKIKETLRISLPLTARSGLAATAETFKKS